MNYAIFYTTHEDKFETTLDAEVRLVDNIVAKADFIRKSRGTPMQYCVSYSFRL